MEFSFDLMVFSFLVIKIINLWSCDNMKMYQIWQYYHIIQKDYSDK